MAHDIFISYSSKDKAVADAVCAHMEYRGMRCWYAPRNIAPGANWAESIIQGLNGAKLMILIFTDFSNDSEQVLREVAYAAEHNIVIVPFRLSGNPPKEKLGSYLKTKHWLDAINKDLAISIQKLGNRCETLLKKINRQDSAIQQEKKNTKGKGAIIAGLIIGGVALIIGALAFAFIVYPMLSADKVRDPSESVLIASEIEADNGIRRFYLDEHLVCDTAPYTCTEFTDLFLEKLQELDQSGDYEAVVSDLNMGTEIFKKGKETPFSLVYLDGDNGMLTGQKKFCIVGLLGEADSTQEERLEMGAALLMASYPEITAEEAEELALVLYSQETLMHAWSGEGTYELLCQVSDEYSFTILNNARYND